VGSVARIAFLALLLLVVLLIAREWGPRSIYPSGRPVGATQTATPTRSITPLPSASRTATIAPQTTFSLVVTDAELTKAAQSSFPQTVSGVTVRDPVVRTTTSGVRLSASARVFFGTTEFVMTGTPYASAGRVAVRVDSITLGGLGLPDSVRAQAAASVESAIGGLVPASVRVDKVTLSDGGVTIEGETRR
jgi:LmeA-like phospholipid-binding